MNFKAKYCLLIGICINLLVVCVGQRLPDYTYAPNIRTVKLFQRNNQQSLPIINLGGLEELELHFDDMDAYVKNYFYSFQLCNADWLPVDLSTFDYLKGFQQNRITQYRPSSLSLSKYVHYQVLLPERNCLPIKSGNYLLKVFLNGDTAKLAFTRRVMVVDSKASIGMQVLQPFNNELFRTHQRLQFSVNMLDLNLINPQQQVKVVVLQNNRWADAVQGINPVFIRGKVLEYNGELDCVFQGGKEWRWADLRSFRFESDRVKAINKENNVFAVTMREDEARPAFRYQFYADKNGWYEIATTDLANPFWQGDYGWVDFTFKPLNGQAYNGFNLYLLGELTGNNFSDSAKMIYDWGTGTYQKRLFLKQGYYSYSYVLLSSKNLNAKPDFSLTEGNYWETENDYTVLVYYRGINGRHDELVAVSSINSRNNRTRF